MHTDNDTFIQNFSKFYIMHFFISNNSQCNKSGDSYRELSKTIFISKINFEIILRNGFWYRVLEIPKKKGLCITQIINFKFQNSKTEIDDLNTFQIQKTFENAISSSIIRLFF